MTTARPLCMPRGRTTIVEPEGDTVAQGRAPVVRLQSAATASEECDNVDSVAACRYLFLVAYLVSMVAIIVSLTNNDD